ncbi:hypothetical protein NKH77_19675 [Streptomyces sp. M19]
MRQRTGRGRVLARYLRENGGQRAPGWPVRRPPTSCCTSAGAARRLRLHAQSGAAAPGDPGRGGGPRTVVGDCVYDADRGEVRETACDGSGARAPRFKVAATVGRRGDCPPATALYIQLGGGHP